MPNHESSRRIPLAIASIAFMAAAFASPLGAHAGDDEEYAKTEYKITPVAERLWMLEGAGGNVTALAGPDGTLLVDSDFAPMASKLAEALKKLGAGPPRYIVNTHFHYDHTGGNAVFGASAAIIAAPALRERLNAPQTLWGKQHAALPARALPDDARVIPGHGPVTDKPALARYHAMILESMSTVRAGMAAGKSLAEIQKSGLPPGCEPFSRGYLKPAQWIAMVHKYLATVKG